MSATENYGMHKCVVFWYLCRIMEPVVGLKTAQQAQ